MPEGHNIIAFANRQTLDKTHPTEYRMRPHIFLTGEIQIGKSTIIQNVLASLDITPGGFKTLGANYAADGSSDVVLMRGSENLPAGRIAAHRIPGVCMTPFPDVFNTFGTACLSEPAGLILMDELGFLESDAKEFQAAVLKTLDGSTPVFGVVRNKDTPFLNAVRAHKNVQVIPITRENRDALPEKIRELIRDRVQSRKESYSA
ncbi:MAG: nucleoside-triphosphatase [Methanocorpusculum sp.]|nr:nucleoside-triphosphatase [Methanocorpusculum sp.]